MSVNIKGLTSKSGAMAVYTYLDTDLRTINSDSPPHIISMILAVGLKDKLKELVSECEAVEPAVDGLLSYKTDEYIEFVNKYIMNRRDTMDSVKRKTVSGMIILDVNLINSSNIAEISRDHNTNELKSMNTESNRILLDTYRAEAISEYVYGRNLRNEFSGVLRTDMTLDERRIIEEVVTTELLYKDIADKRRADSAVKIDGDTTDTNTEDEYIPPLFSSETDGGLTNPRGSEYAATSPGLVSYFNDVTIESKVKYERIKETICNSTGMTPESFDQWLSEMGETMHTELRKNGGEKYKYIHDFLDSKWRMESFRRHFVRSKNYSPGIVVYASDFLVTFKNLEEEEYKKAMRISYDSSGNTTKKGEGMNILNQLSKREFKTSDSYNIGDMSATKFPVQKSLISDLLVPTMGEKLSVLRPNKSEPRLPKESSNTPPTSRIPISNISSAILDSIISEDI